MAYMVPRRDAAYYQQTVARPLPMMEKGAPISAPGVVEGGLIWWVTLVMHLVVWLAAAGSSGMALAVARDHKFAEQLAMAAFTSVLLTIGSVVIAAGGSYFYSVRTQLAATALANGLAVLAVFSHVLLTIDFVIERALGRSIAGSLTAVGATVLTSDELYTAQSATISSLLGYFLLMYFSKSLVDIVSAQKSE